MKGAALTIDMMILLILAIVALAAIIYLFFTTWSSSSPQIATQSEWRSACTALASFGNCKVENVAKFFKDSKLVAYAQTNIAGCKSDSYSYNPGGDDYCKTTNNQILTCCTNIAKSCGCPV